MFNKKNVFRILIIFSWVIAIYIGFVTLWKYDNKPGEPIKRIERWPETSRLNRNTNRATLIMAVHPHCPCSRASIGELARIMAELNGNITAQVLFYKPAEQSDNWAKSDLWQSALEIPGVTTIIDTDGLEAEKFQTKVSGQVLLYNSRGENIFSGGITAARGHYGDNPGHDAIVSLVTFGIADKSQTPVFGCQIIKSGA